MTEHEENGTTERLSAHERLATGALARWMRMCADNPWKVVLTWIAIIAALIVLVATIGGSLRDEFSIPGSDTQKATDLIEAEFASEQGAVLNIVFAAPEGERLDTPERKAAIAQGDRAPEDRRVQAEGTARPASRASPTRSARTRSRRTGASPTPRRSSTRRSRTPTGRRSWRSRTRFGRRWSPPG